MSDQPPQDREELDQIVTLQTALDALDRDIEHMESLAASRAPHAMNELPKLKVKHIAFEVQIASTRSELQR